MNKKYIIGLALTLCLLLVGSVALAANYCISCGEYLGGQYNFCPNCGTAQPSGGGSNPAPNPNPNPNPNPASTLSISRLSKNEDGALNVIWTDSGNNAPYKIYALQKHSNSFTEDMTYPIGRQLCQEDLNGTTGLANKVVPGYDYWIIVEDCNGNMTYKEYDGGTAPRFNEFGVEADVMLKYSRDNAFEEVYAFSADDIRRYKSSTSYGARINLTYPQLSRDRQYSMLVAIKDPNGDVVVDAVTEDLLYRGRRITYYYNFYTFDEYFDILIDAYGAVPTGTYTWMMYYDGQFVTSDTFRITY